MFFLKISQTRFFPKKRSGSVLSLYSPLTSNKESEKSLEPYTGKRSKSLFSGQFGPEMPENRKTDIFSKNRALSLFSPYTALTSYKESEKSLEPFSGKRSKSLFSGQFGPEMPVRPNFLKNENFAEHAVFAE